MVHGRVISREPGLTVVELSGSPYDIGLAHGRLLGPEIALMRARLSSYLSSISHGMGGPLVWLFGQLARRMERFTPEHIRAELRGIADGSCQGYRFIFLMNALDDLLVNMACSAVALGPGSTADGEVLAGRNLDYPLFYDLLPSLNTVLVVKPDAGLPFISVGWPGFAAVVTGMNGAGLFLADLTSLTRDRRLAGTPALIVNRMALQGARTLDEAEAVYKSARRTVGKNIMAASPEGARVFELTAKEIAVRLPGDGPLICTNHFETPALVKRQGSVKPPPKSDFPAEYYSYAFSKERMDAISDRLSHPEAAGTQDVMAALGTGPVANRSTVQSVVCLPASRRLHVAVRTGTPVSAGEYRELSGLL